MLNIDYVHHGYTDIRTLQAKQCKEEFCWSFDNFKNTHLGTKECFISIIDNIRKNATILLTQGDLFCEKEEIVLDIFI